MLFTAAFSWSYCLPKFKHFGKLLRSPHETIINKQKGQQNNAHIRNFVRQLSNTNGAEELQNLL